MSENTPLQAMSDAIIRWEGTWQADPADRGNYTPLGKLVGTMRGVTVSAFAGHVGMSPEYVTEAMMKQQVTPEFAALIGLESYYKLSGLDTLPWTPVTENALDFAWASGPVTAIKHLQSVIGANADGVIGEETKTKLVSFIEANGLQVANDAYAHERAGFYTAISAPGTPRNKYRVGWLRRANWYLSSNREFWDKWDHVTIPVDRVYTPVTVVQPVPMSVPHQTWWQWLRDRLGV